MIRFFVPGIPIAKGNMRIFTNTKGKPFMVDKRSASLSSWASEIKSAAMKAKATVSHDAVCLDMVFHMQRPKSHYNRKGDIKESMIDKPHITRSDLDKMVRMVLDSLTGIAYADDSQVCYLDAEKSYADEGTGFKPGVTIEIS